MATHSAMPPAAASLYPFALAGAAPMLSATRNSRECHMRFTPALIGALMAAAVGGIASPAGAQTWPTRSIMAISPFSAGNAVDITGRVVLDQLSRQVGQAIVIENRPGAGGTIAFNSVAK